MRGERRKPLGAILAALLLLGGCGTTRWSDTARTGTEQLLMSSVIDQAIDQIDFSPLRGMDVYFDEQYLKPNAPPPPGLPPRDEYYLASAIRQQLLANGCVLKSDRKEATYVVEARVGALGTNRHELMLGVPSLNLPTVAGLPAGPSAIPEIPFAKTTDQKGVAKVALFAYNQKTGKAVWQSGTHPVISTARDSWVMGMGPWQRGTIYDGMRFAGSRLILSPNQEHQQDQNNEVAVTESVVFDTAEEPAKLAVDDQAKPLAAASEPAAPATAQVATASSPATATAPATTAQAAAPPNKIVDPAVMPASATAPAGSAPPPTTAAQPSAPGAAVATDHPNDAPTNIKTKTRSKLAKKPPQRSWWQFWKRTS